ncbi:MAG: hypothetical protein QOH60_776, partial [Mycobacterium sp.]|nr:hypothetical protein [Mycobacterium sp.]
MRCGEREDASRGSQVCTRDYSNDAAAQSIGWLTSTFQHRTAWGDVFERDGTASRPAQSQREAKLGRARSSTDNGTQLPRLALRRQPSAVLRLQRLAGNKAVAEWLSESPPAAVQRSPGDINDQDLLLHVVVGGDSVAWVFPVSEIGTNATQFLKGSSGEIAKIEAEVAKAVAGPAGLLAENRVYLESPPVAADLQKDVEDWPAKRTLTRFPARLAARAQAVKDTRLRYPLETQIATSAGISPAQIDWRREIAAMRAQPPDSTTMVEASRADRFDLALQVLEEEAAAGVQPVGNEPLHTLVFKPLIYAKYAATDPPPSEFNADALTKTHSEAFLTTWLPKIRYVRLVPDNFDLSPFAPTGDLDPVRKALVEKYIDEAAPRTMEKYLLDMWTADALKRSPEQFLKTADLGGVKGSLVTHLAKDFHRWARTQPDFHGAFWAEVGQRAAFAAVTAMFTAGRAVQKYNENLAERFEHAKLLDLDQEEFGIAKDPYGYLERLEDAAKVTNALTQTMTPGKSLEGNLLGWYEGALTAWSPGTPNARMGALLLGFVNTLDSLKKTVEAQEKNVGKELSKDLTTSYPKIEAIIRNESRYAEEFITSKWIPMLKTVALEQITKNRDDMKEHVAKWPEYRERTAAKFRICAHVLDDLITRLNSGDLDSIELDGQLLTKDQVPQLENARDFMQGQADTYADESDAEEKKDDMQDAVDGFEKVRKRILSGDYKPVDYTKAVYDEARKRLGLTGYADLTTMGQALDRWVVVPDNPFLAYAIARWQWEEHVKELDHEFKVFLALGLLTLASLVVPGAAGVVLTAIDIGVGIVQGIGAVQDAYALLDMAKLDDNGTVRGVTVEQARAALKTAWIGLGLNILLAGAGIATLFGRLIL